MPRVAIQTALYKSSKYLPVLLQSLKEQTEQDFVLYACENSCDREEAARAQQLLEASGIQHHLLINKDNLGFAGGHNALFRLHEAPYVMILNDDAYLEPTHLAASLARFAADPRCASVAGVVYRWTADPSQRQVLEGTTLIDTMGLRYRCLANVVDVNVGKMRQEIEKDLVQAREIFGVSGAICLYDREKALSVSPDQLLFDPLFFMYKEDVDLAIRLRRKGYTAWFDPAIVSFHRRSIKVESNGLLGRLREERKRPAHLRRAMYRNQFRLYVYHWSWKLGLRDIVKTKIHACLYAGSVFAASPRVFFGAWGEILQDLPRAFRYRRALQKMGLKKCRLYL